MDICFQLSWDEIARLYRNSMFYFLRNSLTIFPSGYLTIPPAEYEGSSFSASSSTLPILWLLVSSNLMDAEWELTVMSICISTGMNGIGHHMMYSLGLWVSPWRKGIFKCSVSSTGNCFCVCLCVWRTCMWQSGPPQVLTCLLWDRVSSLVSAVYIRQASRGITKPSHLRSTGTTMRSAVPCSTWALGVWTQDLMLAW